MNFILSFAEIVLDLPLDYDWEKDYGDDEYVKALHKAKQAPAVPAPAPRPEITAMCGGKAAV